MLPRIFALTVCSLAATLTLAACASGSRSGPSASGSASDAAGTHSGQSLAAEAAPATPLRAGERFETVSMPRPYTPKAPNGGTDEYRCFLLDPQLTAPAFLTGNQFVPQNVAMVHHAILYRVDTAITAAARGLDARSPEQGWTCFGDDGLGDSAWVGHWAPGVVETPLTPGVGYDLPVGSMLVVQVHYNLLAVTAGTAGSDQSAVRLRLTDDTTGIRALETAQLSAPIELPCTPEESGPLCDRDTALADVAHRFGQDVGQTEPALLSFCSDSKPAPGPTQSCDYPVEQAGTVYAVAGHMHLLGRSISIELNPGKPDAQALLEVPVYNFDDQGIRVLTAPVRLKAGDTLRVTCRHDATLRKLVPALQKLPPRYVVWGDGTSDEMCLGLVVLTPTT